MRVSFVESLFSIGLQKNCQAGGSFGLAPRLVSDLRGAMVHHAFENLFRARTRHFFVLGFGIVLLSSRSIRMLFVRKLVFNSLPKKMSSGELVRPRSPLGLRPAVGQWCIMLFTIFSARARSTFFCFCFRNCCADLVIETFAFHSCKEGFRKTY